MALVVLLAVAYYNYAPRETPAGQPPLVLLSPQNFSEFQKQFNDSAASVRVVTLLSPT